MKREGSHLFPVFPVQLHGCRGHPTAQVEGTTLRKIGQERACRGPGDEFEAVWVKHGHPRYQSALWEEGQRSS